MKYRKKCSDCDFEIEWNKKPKVVFEKLFQTDSDKSYLIFCPICNSPIHYRHYAKGKTLP